MTELKWEDGREIWIEMDTISGLDAWCVVRDRLGIPFCFDPVLLFMLLVKHCISVVREKQKNCRKHQIWYVVPITGSYLEHLGTV